MNLIRRLFGTRSVQTTTPVVDPEPRVASCEGGPLDGQDHKVEARYLLHPIVDDEYVATKRAWAEDWQVIWTLAREFGDTEALAKIPAPPPYPVATYVLSPSMSTYVYTGVSRSGIG